MRKEKLQHSIAKKMIYVIGCGYSGTEYTAKWLQSQGLDVRHERWGRDGIVFWKWTVENLPKESIIWHVVRNPLDTISACTEFTKWGFISEYIAINPGDSCIRKAMKYYCYWNRLAQVKASCTFRVESLYPPIRRTKSRTTTQLSWEQLFEEDLELCNQIMNLARGYGYELTI